MYFDWTQKKLFWFLWFCINFDFFYVFCNIIENVKKKYVVISFIGWNLQQEQSYIHLRMTEGTTELINRPLTGMVYYVIGQYFYQTFDFFLTLLHQFSSKRSVFSLYTTKETDDNKQIITEWQWNIFTMVENWNRRQ